MLILFTFVVFCRIIFSFWVYAPLCRCSTTNGLIYVFNSCTWRPHHSFVGLVCSAVLARLLLCLWAGYSWPISGRWFFGILTLLLCPFPAIFSRLCQLSASRRFWLNNNNKKGFKGTLGWWSSESVWDRRKIRIPRSETALAVFAALGCRGELKTWGQKITGRM